MQFGQPASGRRAGTQSARPHATPLASQLTEVLLVLRAHHDMPPDSALREFSVGETLARVDIRDLSDRPAGHSKRARRTVAEHPVAEGADEDRTFLVPSTSRPYVSVSRAACFAVRCMADGGVQRQS